METDRSSGCGDPRYSVSEEQLRENAAYGGWAREPRNEAVFGGALYLLLPPISTVAHWPCLFAGISSVTRFYRNVLLVRSTCRLSPALTRVGRGIGTYG